MPGGRGTIDSSVHQRRFLECFAACGGSVLVAARWAKLHRQSHYNWLKEDPTYRERFLAAGAKAARTLEDEAIRRAHQGVRQAIFYKGRVVGYKQEYSDQILLKLLAANDPEKFTERQKVQADITSGGQTWADVLRERRAKRAAAQPRET